LKARKDNRAGEASRSEPTPEQTAIISDLHWLIHQDT